MDINDIIACIEPEMTRVERCIRGQIAAPVRMITEVFEYTIGAGGKRLRPAMCLLSAAAVGDVNEDAIQLAACVELIHTASLIHDDVVDASDRRRGKPTANSTWGNQVSVLVGDYMFSKVFANLIEGGIRPWTPLLVRTTERMCEGELLAIEHRGKVDLNEEEYLMLVQNKTAELMAASCEMGGMAAGATPSQLEALRRYGINVGKAFQIVDDLLDIIADDESLGKPVGNDFREGKMTLPLIHTLQTAAPPVRDTILAILSRRPLNQESVTELIMHILQHNSGDYCTAVARQLSEQAKSSLIPLADSPARNALVELADFVVNRTQ